MAFLNMDDPGMVRDTNSKAILFTDDQARRDHREKIAEKQKMQAEINTLKNAMNELQKTVQNDITELKHMLLSLCNKGKV